MRNGEHKLTTEVIEKVDIEIYVDEFGRFRAEVMGESVEKPSLQALRTRVREILRSKQEPIPVTVIAHRRWRGDQEEEELKDGELISIHARTKHYLVRFGKGEIEQVSRYGTQILLRVTAGERAEYLKLHKAALVAQAAFDKYKTALADSKGRNVTAAWTKGA